MSRIDDKDARAFTPGVGVVEALIDRDLPIQTQHAPKRGSLGGLCGMFGQVSPLGIGITCPECRRLMAMRASRRRR